MADTTVEAGAAVVEESVASTNRALWRQVPTRLNSNPFGHRVFDAFYPVRAAAKAGPACP